MTEEQTKEMLNGIINNGEKWEYRWCTADGWSNWKEYKLGDEIFDSYEYRKVETWYVTDNYEIHKDKLWQKLIFKGSKEECEAYIKEHTKKTWLEEYLDINCDDKIEAHNSKIDIENVCKKIMEEVKIKNPSLPFGQKINYFVIEQIIKDLGIKL